MSKIKELEKQVERLGGQLVGVQAALDALIGSTLQSGAASPDTLRTTVRSTIEVFPMNPNMSEQEVAGATSFLTSMLKTIDDIENAAS